MPQDRDSPLARVARAIAAGDGFAFGRPSLSADGEAVMLPILRTRHPPRTCVLSAEVAERITAVDPGRIDRLRVVNESSQRVFLPPGALFEGGVTPSRGTTVGAVLEPGSTTEVEVRCVHASQPIESGAILRLVERPAPDSVRRALLSRDQGLVWAVVRATVSRRREARDGSDDLVSILDRRDGAETAALLSPPGTPAETDQCGAILLGVRGVARVEIFDSPESFQVSVGLASPSSLDRPGALRAPSSVVTLAPDKAMGVAKEFLERLARSASKQAAEPMWGLPEDCAACTFFGDDLVHFVAFGGGPWTESAGDEAAGMGAATGSEFAGSVGASREASNGEGDVAVAQAVAPDADEDAAPTWPVPHPRHRKVLTSGWDDGTFESLERFSKKEFGGDRSAALRFLARQGLRRRGYLGPRASPPPVAVPPSPAVEGSVPGFETDRASTEARIRDFERIAATDVYADWLRVRAREALEHIVSSATDEALAMAARSALERLPGLTLPPEPEELPTEEAAPEAPPVDVRPLLRRAFAASAAGQYSDALHLLDEVLDSEPANRTALLGRAVALRRSGKAPEALAALDLVLRLEPSSAAALLNRGRVLQEMGDLRGALDTFNRLAEVAPNDWDVWVARGDVLARMGRVHDALAAYSEARRRNPDDEGVSAKIRGLERARPPPPPTPAARAALPREIQEGQSYLVREPKPDLSYRLLRSLVVRSVPALVVSRHPATTVWAEHALQGVTVLQLSHEPGEDRAPPTSLASLTSTLERFVLENHGRAAILLDGLSLLLQANGFRDTALFLERVNEAILPSHAIFLVSVAPGDLEEKELAILERSMRALS